LETLAACGYARGRDGGVRRRALELLAASADGATEAIMLAHGFTMEMLVDLVRAGLATGEGRARGKPLNEVWRVEHDSR
jgi:hypothetical protein